MGKILLGLAAGIALTSLAFLVLDGEAGKDPSRAEEIAPLRSLPDGATQVVAESNPQTSARDDAEQPNQVEGSAASAAANSQTRDLTSDQLRNLTLEELQALGKAEFSRVTAENYLLAMGIQGELLRRQNIEEWSKEPPPTQPIMLPSEFAWLTENPDSAHERLQREAIDPDWSFATEAQIVTFLAEHPEIRQKYGQPTVTCRTSGCELAFVAYGVNETVFQIMEGGMFHSVNDQPWADQFWNPGDNWFNAHTEGDVTTILWHLIKDE